MRGCDLIPCPFSWEEKGLENQEGLPLELPLREAWRRPGLDRNEDTAYNSIYVEL